MTVYVYAGGALIRHAHHDTPNAAQASNGGRRRNPRRRGRRGAHCGAAARMRAKIGAEHRTQPHRPAVPLFPDQETTKP